MSYSNYPSGFLNGVTLRGVPIQQLHPGEVFWVNNSTVLAKGGIGGSDGNRGTYQKPFGTIEGALNNGAVKANRGDIIVIMPGYTQTITLATEILFDKAGVAIVGLGTGSLRPTITFGAAAANIPITAANVSVSNILHVNNFADVASNYTATGTATPTDFTLEGNEFRDTTSVLNALTVLTGNATANSLDGLSFLRNRVSSLGATAATTTIVLAEDADRLTINDNFTVHVAISDTAALLECASKNLLSFELARNVCFRPNTSSTGGSFVGSAGTACTGVCHDNRFWQLDASGGIWINVASDLGFFENYSPVTGAADKSGLINPAAV